MQEIRLEASHPCIDELIIQIREMIDEYNKQAITVSRNLLECENFRTQIINTIEEAEHHGLSRRFSTILEDKLKRPYSMLFLKII